MSMGKDGSLHCHRQTEKRDKCIHSLPALILVSTGKRIFDKRLEKSLWFCFVFSNWLGQSIITAYYPNSGCSRGEPGSLSSTGNDGSAGSAGCAGCVTSSCHRWVGLFLHILTRHQEVLKDSQACAYMLLSFNEFTESLGWKRSSNH